MGTFQIGTNPAFVHIERKLNKPQPHGTQRVHFGLVNTVPCYVRYKQLKNLCPGNSVVRVPSRQGGSREFDSRFGYKRWNGGALYKVLPHAPIAQWFRAPGLHPG